MSMQLFDQAASPNEFSEDDISSLEKQKSVPVAIADSADTHKNGYDCNICMDSVQDPVVTLCGHLYCWPCIYKWIQYKSDSSENGGDHKQQQCPVCKAEVSQTTLVPLYCRGHATKSAKGKAPELGVIIPRRPHAPAYGIDALIPTNNHSPTPYPHHRTYTPQSQQRGAPHAGYAAPQMFSLGGMTQNLFEPVIGMFVEMVFTRINRNPMTNIYTYPQTHHEARISSPRVRRHVIEADRSLGRICCFLYCCVFLCLLLF